MAARTNRLEEETRHASGLLRSEDDVSTRLSAAADVPAASKLAASSRKLSERGRSLNDGGEIQDPAEAATKRQLKKLNKKERAKFQKKRILAAAGKAAAGLSKAKRLVDDDSNDIDDDTRECLTKNAVQTKGKPVARATKAQARRANTQTKRTLTRAVARKKAAAKGASAAQQAAENATGIVARVRRVFTRSTIAGGTGVAWGAVGGGATTLICILLIALIVGSVVASGMAKTGWNLDGLNANEKTIAMYLKDKGLDKMHTAAIMGNLMQESRCDPTTTQVPTMIGGGIGLVQWGYGVDGGRGNALFNWASAMGRPWSDITIQLDWMWAEMVNEGRAKDQTSWFSHDTSPAMFTHFCAETDIAVATEYWEEWIEKAGIAEMPTRIKYAREYLAILNKGGSDTDNQAIIDAARSQLGVPYLWGGTTPNIGLDCSGLTQYCYAQAGLSLSRTTYSQIAQCSLIDLATAVPGDLVFMSFSALGVPEHVGIYIGDGMMIHAPQAGEVIKIGAVFDINAQYARFIG